MFQSLKLMITIHFNEMLSQKYREKAKNYEIHSTSNI